MESVMAGEGGVKEVAMSNTWGSIIIRQHGAAVNTDMTKHQKDILCWQRHKSCDTTHKTFESLLNLACSRSRPTSLPFSVSPQNVQSLGIPNNIANDVGKKRDYLRAAKNLWWTCQTQRRWQRLEEGLPTILVAPCQGKVWGSPTGPQGPVKYV